MQSTRPHLSLAGGSGSLQKKDEERCPADEERQSRGRKGIRGALQILSREGHYCQKRHDVDHNVGEYRDYKRSSADCKHTEPSPDQECKRDAVERYGVAKGYHMHEREERRTPQDGHGRSQGRHERPQKDPAKDYLLATRRDERQRDDRSESV